MSQSAPFYPSAAMADEMLTHGTLSRRIAGFVIDGVIVLVIWKLLAIGCFVFGILTLGLGMPLLPVVPPAYNWLGLLSPLSATPGQAIMGLVVRRDDDLGPPGALAAALWVGGFYLSLALSGLPLLTALFSPRRRTLHDIGAGLVVVRSRALTGGAGFWNMAPGGPWRP
jgi:uncharacterized RDD family membrane protein YckC